MTQYKAIFGEDDQTHRTARCDENKLLNSWLSKKVEQFLKTLETDLSRGISSLETVLGQCMYFGMSFSRIGADFRAQMAPIFVRHIAKHVEEHVKVATKEFQLEMENYTLINKISVRKDATTTAGYLEDPDNISPPESLMDYRPLANYCNAILNLLNEVRLCAPLAVATHLTRALEGSLHAMGNAIVLFYKQEQQAFTGTEKENFVRFCSTFVYDLIPYLQRCVHVLFSLQTMAEHLGVAVTALQKSGVTYFNQKMVVGGIEHLLPVKEVIQTSVLEEDVKTVEENVGQQEVSTE